PHALATPRTGSNVPLPVTRMDSNLGLFLFKATGAPTILKLHVSAWAAAKGASKPTNRSPSKPLRAVFFCRLIPITCFLSLLFVLRFLFFITFTQAGNGTTGCKFQAFHTEIRLLC